MGENNGKSPWNPTKTGGLVQMMVLFNWMISKASSLQFFRGAWFTVANRSRNMRVLETGVSIFAWTQKSSWEKTTEKKWPVEKHIQHLPVRVQFLGTPNTHLSQHPEMKIQVWTVHTPFASSLTSLKNIRFLEETKGLQSFHIFGVNHTRSPRASMYSIAYLVGGWTNPIEKS